MDKQKARESFENFLIEMDDRLDGVREEAERVHVDLDMSVSDFDRLESLFDKLSAGMSDDKKKDLVVSLGRYLGELVCHLYGGKWVLPLEDEKSINFNTPVVVGHAAVPGLEFAPLATMRAYALRKRPGTLKRAALADVRPQAVDLSDLIED